MCNRSRSVEWVQARVLVPTKWSLSVAFDAKYCLKFYILYKVTVSNTVVEWACMLQNTRDGIRGSKANGHHDGKVICLVSWRKPHKQLQEMVLRQDVCSGCKATADTSKGMWHLPCEALDSGENTWVGRWEDTLGFSIFWRKSAPHVDLVNFLGLCVPRQVLQKMENNRVTAVS